jgi:PAS domain S-box-containing protein
VRAGGRNPGGSRERRAFEETLREREEFLRTIGDNLPDGMLYQLVRTPDGGRRFNHVSGAVRRLHGCSPEEALADAGRVYATVHPDDRERVVAEEEAANAAFTVFRTEVRRIAPDGEVRWSSFVSKPRRLADGSTSWDGVEIDVTERKRVEEALRRSEESHRAVARLTTGYVVRLELGAGGRPVPSLVSEGLLGEIGRTLEELRGPGGWEGVVHPDDLERVTAFLGDLAANGGPGEIEARIGHRDGSWRCVHVLAEAVRDPSTGGTTAILAGVSDVTARRKAEREAQALQERLLAVNRELAAALRMKDEFLSSMSHELRTPLNAVLGFLQALREEVYGPLAPRLLRAAGFAEEAGKHLLALISDILDLSKVQAGRLALDLAPVPVRALCEASLHLVDKAAEKKRIRLGLEVGPEVSTVVADGRRLKQIVVNLLANAVKFTPEGGHVLLDVRGDAGRDAVRVTVTDDGIGIPEERLGLLFHPFTQVESGLSRAHEGTGLGLSLVLGLAELHGGGVEVRSRPGEGSSFAVTIPWRRGGDLPDGGEDRNRARPCAAPAKPRAPGRGESLLLVEDNEHSAAVLSDYLVHAGFRVTVATSGLEALRLAPGLSPDLILMDVQMPGLDGLETIRRLRADDGLRQTPVLAVTALAMPGDRERCLAAGADGYLTKPLDLPALVRTIVAAVARAGAAAGGAP